MPDFIWINCSVWSMSRPLNASFAISKILIKFIRGPKSQQRRIMRTGWREQCTRSSPYNAMWSTHYDLERDVICSRGEVGSIRRIGVILWSEYKQDAERRIIDKEPNRNDVNDIALNLKPSDVKTTGMNLSRGAIPSSRRPSSIAFFLPIDGNFIAGFGIHREEDLFSNRCCRNDGYDGREAAMSQLSKHRDNRFCNIVLVLLNLVIFCRSHDVVSSITTSNYDVFGSTMLPAGSDHHANFAIFPPPHPALPSSKIRRPSFYEQLFSTTTSKGEDEIKFPTVLPM
ncbi:hypothetical protein U1Q18_049368 [Sarracenia purpurea var. burkii]